jgi:hypothetical protein
MDKRFIGWRPYARHGLDRPGDTSYTGLSPPHRVFADAG